MPCLWIVSSDLSILTNYSDAVILGWTMSSFVSYSYHMSVPYHDYMLSHNTKWSTVIKRRDWRCKQSSFSKQNKGGALSDPIGSILSFKESYHLLRIQITHPVGNYGGWQLNRWSSFVGSWIWWNDIRKKVTLANNLINQSSHTMNASLDICTDH